MALREIRQLGDPILTKVCKEIKEVTPRIRELIDDMLDTMYEAGGVGLAAPQVGVLRRVCVIDIGEEDKEPYILINPRIVRADGEQTGDEGCLSLPGKAGKVTRPNHVVVEAYDMDMTLRTIEGEELLARALCHEIDHLDGHMYVEKAEGGVYDVKEEAAEDAEEEGDNK